MAKNELYCGLGYAGVNSIIGRKVTEIYPFSPLMNTDIKQGDRIMAVQERGGEWKPLTTDAAQEERGETRGIAGTSVKLRIHRLGEARNHMMFETDWIRREVIVRDRNEEIELDSSHECGLIGSLTPPAHINVALSEGLTPHSNQRS